MDFETRYNMSVIGDVPKGLPEPTLPKLGKASNVIGDCFAIAIVAYAIPISIGRMFARKHKYRIDENQVSNLTLCKLIYTINIHSFE